MDVIIQTFNKHLTEMKTDAAIVVQTRYRSYTSNPAGSLNADQKRNEAT